MSPLHSCSICSSTFAEGEGLTLDVSSTGSSRRIGGYCRVRCRDAARALLDLYESGKIKPHISIRLPLAEAPRALATVAEGKSTGKVILTV